MAKTLKEKALALAAKGFAVFPLKHNSKRPFPGSSGFKEATTNAFEIEAWWNDHPMANIGLYPDACRPRLLIVDVDKKKGGDETAAELSTTCLPPTLTISTPSGGRHLYYALDKDFPAIMSSVEKLGPGIDIRSHGGYVVAPGSRVDGKRYTILHRAPIASAPITLTAACGRAEKRHTDADKWLVEPDLPSNIKAAIQWLKDTEPAVEGSGGNDHTYQTAAMLRDRGISEDRALNLMLEHWNERCSPRPWPEDMLTIVVHNVYRYAKRPAGTEAFSRKAAALQTVASSPEVNKKPVNRYQPVTLDELDRRPPPKWLVQGVFPETGLGELVGAMSSYKSFLILDAAMHIVHGRDWMGFKTLQRPVVYVAGEGAGGMRARARAWHKQHEIAENPADFHLVEVMPPFASMAEVQALYDAIKHIKPGLIILDTLARAIPGLDENSAKDIGLFVHAADALWQKLQCFVIYLHHTGKDEKRGSRGSTAGPAALDVQLTVQADRVSREAYLRMTKAKDVEMWPEKHVFKGFRVDLDPGTNSLAFVHKGAIKNQIAKDDPDTSGNPEHQALQSTRWDYMVEILAGKSASEAITTSDLAMLIARATTADDDWPEEGPVQNRLVKNVIRWLDRTVALSPDGRRWVHPGTDGSNRLWRAPPEDFN